MNQIDFKIRHVLDGNEYGGESYSRSDVTVNNYVKKVHPQIDCKSNGNFYGVDSSIKPKREVIDWVTKNSVVSDVRYLEIATMIHNNNNYKRCNY